MEKGWIDAGGGYSLALLDGKLACRNEKGNELKSVPKGVRDSKVGRQLLTLRDWLKRHERECAEQVEAWMLRSLTVPRAAIAATWDDPAWRTPLHHAVVCPLEGGELDLSRAGFLEGASVDRGIGVVDLDGESRWLDAPEIVLPHPILLSDLDDWRELATDLGFSQGLSQLFRETFARAAKHAGTHGSVTDFAEGKFAQLNHALGKCRTLGYRVRGGYAVCPVWEDGRSVEARYWIGADYPEGETFTGELVWVDDRERNLKLADVGPVAFSEGMRMASAIYAARVVEEEKAS